MTENECPTLQEFLDACNNCDIKALRDEIALHSARLDVTRQRWEERLGDLEAQSYADQMGVIRPLIALIQRMDIICGRETPVPIPFRVETEVHEGRTRGPNALMFDSRRCHDSEPPDSSTQAQNAWHHFTSKLGIPPAQLRFALGLGWIAVYRLNVGTEIYVSTSLEELKSGIHLSPCQSPSLRNHSAP